ncbi:unnamed protein product [Ostreobium quekettii]|uniref:Sec16 Sec23-binding domain-containing protein n=1 Tax=Ostreobium quekettii TaxID=121088 RepID=A0A8S1J0H3_9CHLO|nr:unnamed protein product [Ostreobium quekettii]|eukprot:evm.model.scf_179.5 EVM.evm.TU.scf_179.5   scf_179:36038-46258(+)
MGYLRRVDRSAAVGFCPVGPYLAAGSAASAVDMNFSASSVLEIFKLDFSSSDVQMEPAGPAVPASERFHRISWGTTGIESKAYPLGLAAGGLEDGTVLIWDPNKAIGPQADIQRTTVTKLKKHSSAVRGLEFNRISPNLFASGSSESELIIWDLAKPAVPSFYPAMKGSTPAGAGVSEITYLAWNVKVQHILASCTSNGQTNVFDLRRQKPIAILRDLNSQRRCSVFQWSPDVATQVVVASEDDRSPSLQLWDLRNSAAPAREFLGHTKGVLGMSWCPHDSRLLLSCAKDGSTFCWNVPTGEIIGELPGTRDWHLDVQWSPTTPGLFSLASFDGTVGICSLQSFVAPQEGAADPYGAQAGGPAPLKLAPVWMRRPCGVSFGFGGKLVSFSHPEVQVADPTTGQPMKVQKDQISVKQVITEPDVTSRSEAFDQAVSSRDNAKLHEYCQSRAKSAVGDEQETWTFLSLLFLSDSRRELLGHLGFEDALAAVIDAEAEAEQKGAAVTPGKPVPDAAEFFDDDGADFFDQIADDKTIGVPPEPAHPKPSSKSEDAVMSPSAHTRAPSKAGEKEDEIQRALIVGNYEAAVEACIKADRMADALIIAHAGGSALHKKTMKRYMEANPRPFMTMISAVIDNDFEVLINQRLVSQWRETLALVISYVNDQESWSSLSEALAARLAKAGMQHPATLCYIISGKVDQAVAAWTKNKKMTVETMQNIIEKAVVLGLGANKSSTSPVLCELVHNYALILASQGSMQAAVDYLNMVPGDASESVNYLLKRIYDSGAVGWHSGETGAASMSQGAQMPSQVATQPTPSPAQYQYVQQPDTPPSTVQATYYPSSSGYNQTMPYSQAPQATTQDPYGYQMQQHHPQPMQQRTQDMMYPGPPQQQHAPPVMTPAPMVPQQYTAPHPTTTPVMAPFEPVPSHPSAPQPRAAVMTPQVGPSPPGLQAPGPMVPSMGQPMSPVAPASPPAPQGPPADISVSTVNTSQVPPDQRAIVAKLTELFRQCEAASQTPGKRREIADGSKRLGTLFWKMNEREVSPAMIQRLQELTKALEAGNVAAALQIQLHMTEDGELWAEGEYWLPGLKRLLRTRQLIR